MLGTIFNAANEIRGGHSTVINLSLASSSSYYTASCQRFGFWLLAASSTTLNKVMVIIYKQHAYAS